jgi:hypothetical protein
MYAKILHSMGDVTTQNIKYYMTVKKRAEIKIINNEYNYL